MRALTIVANGPGVGRRVLQPALFSEGNIERCDGDDASLEAGIVENAETLQDGLAEVVLDIDLVGVEFGKRLQK